MPGVETNWYALLASCLADIERSQISSPCAVVDHEIVSGRTGDAEDFRVWLICRTPEQKQQFSDTALGRTVAELHRRLLQRGFPENALASLSVSVTSRPEIAQAGGRLR